MALVILSAGPSTRSKMHTVSAVAVGLGAVAAIALTLVGGFALGYGYGHRSSVAPVQEAAEVVPDVRVEVVRPEDKVVVLPEGRMVIDRFGELSGRMVQLEAEAAELAARLEAIGEFEARIKSEPASAKAKAKAKASQPQGPAAAGGPLLRPRSAKEADPVALLEELADAPATPEYNDRVLDGLSKMERDIDRLAETLSAIDAAAISYNLAHMSFPGRSPVPEKRVTSGFGNRVDPFKGRLAFHSGVDFTAPKGTPILASAGGRVAFAGYKKDYGNTVEIDHGAGLMTRYAHASKLHVKVGQVVMPGQKIGEVGSTGRSTGPHLHFEILKDGAFADPTRYLARF